MTTIACVLRSGGHYTPEWVRRLRSGVRRHLPVPHAFVCLTDVEANYGLDVQVRPLRYGWPKWWPKLELFRPDLFAGPVLYMDLDTLPVGDMSDLVSYDGPLALISDFYRPSNGQSGVMAFTPGPETEAVWDAFRKDPQAAMKRWRGDGEFIYAHAPDAPRLQTLFPGQIVSLKVEAKHDVPAGARLVCGHGNPKFDHRAAGWAHKHWMAA